MPALSEIAPLLRCPRTHGPLRLRPDHSGFSTLDDEFFYPIEDGICDFQTDSTPVKQSVQDFYDTVGWTRSGSSYTDTELFVDQRDLTAAYRRRCAERVVETLPAEGRFLLDAASGPVPDGAETEYARGYDVHVCVDLSRAALLEARRNLGERGVYLLADITNLPLANDGLDAIVSLHTLYHVPADEQRKALLELHRVLKPGGRAVVVYYLSRTASLTRVLLFPQMVVRFLRHRFRRRSEAAASDAEAESSSPSLYHHTHPLSWFSRHDWPFALDVRVYRSLDWRVIGLYIHKSFGGRTLLNGVRWLEDRFPSALARIGAYPMFVIDKTTWRRVT